MKFLVLDFETTDPYIGLDMGAGWVYALKQENSLFKVLSFSYFIINNNGINSPISIAIHNYSAALLTINNLINQVDGVIMHNATYDLGCLNVLGMKEFIFPIYDTKIIAHLYDNTLESYSLDNLSKRYLSNEDRKNKNLLFDAVINYNLAPHLIPKKPSKDQEKFKKKIEKWAYSNMKELLYKAPNEFHQYAQMDVVATGKLFQLFTQKIDLLDAQRWSRPQVVLNEIRKRGIKVDLWETQRIANELSKKSIEVENRIRDQIGHDILLSSNKQLGTKLKELGFKLQSTLKGNLSVNKEFLESNLEHPLIKDLYELRKLNKIRSDFLIKILDMQKYTCPEAYQNTLQYGIIYPQLHLFGTTSGRFSSSCPNIQQIPKRDPKYGKLVRQIFVPHSPKHKWISADFSNQEGRLQVHFAKKIGAPQVSALVEKFKQDSKLNLHIHTGELMFKKKITKNDPEYNMAKTINLGISYGMGIGKLGHSLGFPSIKVQSHYDPEREVYELKSEKDINTTSNLLKGYYKAAPYLKVLSDACQKTIKSRGYLITLGKRNVRLPKEKAYAALNYLIQPSAADQCIFALMEAHTQGLQILNTVHDEINIEGTEEDAKKLQHIMETIVDLEIPMIADVSIGTNWGNTK